MNNDTFAWTYTPEGIAELRRLWEEGKASGLSQPFDIERLLQEARRRLAESQESPSEPE